MFRALALLTIQACTVTTALAQTATGYTFTMTMSSKSSVGGPGSEEIPQRAQYTRTTLVSARGRTRTNFDSVGGIGLHRQGEYSLADAAGSVTVRPASNTYSIAPNFADINVDSMMSATGLGISVKLLKASVDSLGPGERIDGRPTMKYRLSLTQEIAIEAKNAGIPEELAAALKNTTTTTMDFWYAKLPIIPTDFSFEDVARYMKMRPAAMGPLMHAMDSLFTRLPKDGMAIRTVTTSAYAGNGMLAIFEMKSDVGAYKSVSVDLKSLTVPDDYKEVADPDANPMFPIKPDKNSARWKGMAWTQSKGPAKP